MLLHLCLTVSNTIEPFWKKNNSEISQQELHTSFTSILFPNVDLIHSYLFFRCHLSTLGIACSRAACTVMLHLTFLSKKGYTVHVPNSTSIFKLLHGFTYIANINWSCINFSFFFRSFRDCKKSYHLHWIIMLDIVCYCILSSYQYYC